MTDLVGRLREPAGDSLYWLSRMKVERGEAADAIEAQAREIAEWKAAADTEARMKRYAESQLSAARRDALEEAAKVAESKAACKADVPLTRNIAAAIRSLSSPVHAGEGGFTDTDKQAAVPCAANVLPQEGS